MISQKEIISSLEKVRSTSPLVHNITNYVVMNNTANALLSIGASPVMAHAVEEMENMVEIASSLVINIGTLSKKWIEAMLKAGKKASEKGIPVVFDPVGAGATKYRTDVAETIIKTCNPTIIRGNASEIMALSNTGIKPKGVDSTMSADSALDSAKLIAKETFSIVVISGERDYITNGIEVIAIQNGSTLMSKVTGMGCTATAIIGAFVGVETNRLMATVAAMAVMGITGEIAAEISEGPGSMQLNFLDTLYKLSAEDISSHLKLSYE